MANYVVLARFDAAADQALIGLREKLIKAGYQTAIGEWPPHITLAAYENIDVNALLPWAKEFAEQRSEFEIRISSLGIFPPRGEHTETAVLYAMPAASKKLIDFYYAFHEKLDEYCGSLGWWYSARFGFPAIHSTIGIFYIKNIQGAMEMIFAAPIFGAAKITALEVYTYPMELIGRFELSAQRQ